MPTLAELTDPYVGSYRPVPPSGPGICEVCHSQPGVGFTRCWSCEDTGRQVSRPVDLVVPIAMCEYGGQLHTLLRRYKSAGVATVIRNEAALRLAGLAGRFLARHSECIARASGMTWEGVVPVPSTQGRVGAHPLEAVLRMLPLHGDSVEPLLGPGKVAATHNRPSDVAFTVREDVRNRRLLVFDDTFTSGARAQSAASALQLAGARVVAITVIGRFVRPDRVPDLWDRISKAPYDFSRCCLEVDDDGKVVGP